MSILSVNACLQERDAVAAVLLDLLVPASLGEGGRVTPGVVVESVEVAALVVGAAVHVLGHLEAVAFDICCRVAHRDLPVASGADVLSQVAGDGLDVRGSRGGLVIVDDLVAREEEKGVVVVGESVNGGEQALEVDLVVRRAGVGAVERVLRGVDVQGEVDAGVCEGGHALVVVGSVVHGVHTNGVDAQLLELYDVALAAVDVGNGVLGLRGATGLVVNTANVEAVVTGPEGCSQWLVGVGLVRG